MKKGVTEEDFLSLSEVGGDLHAEVPKPVQASHEAGLHQAHCTQNVLQQKISSLQSRLSLGINEFSSGFEC